jgi:hypothetical protein
MIFEIAILTILAVAMVITSQPQKQAITVVFWIAVIAMMLNIPSYYFTKPEERWILAFLIVDIQYMGALLLILYSTVVRTRMYYLIIAAFAMLMSFYVVLYRNSDIIEFSTYVMLYKSTKVAQILFIMYFSDGTWKIARNIRNIRGAFFGNRVNSPSIRN